MQFTLRQLETFVAVARQGSFAGAADRLNISPPAVSDQIAALERRLGYSLFIRRRGSTPLLSPEGLSLLDSSEAILRETRKLDSSVRATQPHKAPIRAFVSPYMLDASVIPRIATFIEDYPEIAFNFDLAIAQDEVACLVERQQLNFAIFTIYDNAPLPPGTRAVVPVTCSIYSAPNAPWNRAEVDPAGLPYVMPADPLHLRTIMAMLRENGIEPVKIVARTQFPSVMLNLVKNGVGVSSFTAEIAAPHGLVAVGPPLRQMRRVYVVNPAAESDDVHQLASFIWSLVGAEHPLDAEMSNGASGI